jgi:catechol 2,3-dioxygenase-like lactoylglutathione lyase family enzyme
LKARYKHTSIIASDWQSLSRFYQEVFGCIPVPPVRHLSGDWLDKGTGIRHARLEGIHLRLPGYGDNGPTVEIFQYSENIPKLHAAANREGFGHIAFEVDDVHGAMLEVLRHGGSKVGEATSAEVEGAGMITFVYLADPEGNIIELQAWK